MTVHFYQSIPSKESSATYSPQTPHADPRIFQADFSSLHSSRDDLTFGGAPQRDGRGLLNALPRREEARLWKWSTILLAVVVVFLLSSRFATTRVGKARADAATASTLVPLPVAEADIASADNSSSTQASPTTSTSPPPPPPPPLPYRLEDDIVLITKSGSATVYERFLVHMQGIATDTLYQPNTFYVSDLPLQVGDITFWDALAHVSPRISASPDFHRLRTESQGLAGAHQLLTVTKDKDAGWKLDKYKFLPMMAEAWRRFPRKKWYVVVEADTFLFWKQMVRFLETQLSSSQLLFGHEVFVDFEGSRSTPFTHGGSGFVLSHALMETTFGSTVGYAEKWDDLVLENSYGDAVLCKALYDSPGSNITSLSRVPEVGVDMFHGNAPRDLPFGRWDWCKPVLTYHHVSPNDVARLYDFQRRIEPLLPARPTAIDDEDEKKRFHHMILHSDIWQEFRPTFLKQALEEVRIDKEASEEVTTRGWRSLREWDDARQTDSDDPLDCQATCRRDSECLQWTFIPRGEEEKTVPGNGRRGTCRYTTDRIRIGTYEPHKRQLTSGWFVKRIETWGRQLGCSGQRLNGSL